MTHHEAERKPSPEKPDTENATKIERAKQDRRKHQQQGWIFTDITYTLARGLAGTCPVDVLGSRSQADHWVQGKEENHIIDPLNLEEVRKHKNNQWFCDQDPVYLQQSYKP